MSKPIEPAYKPYSELRKICPIVRETLIEWTKKGKVSFVRTPGGKRYYNVTEFSACIGLHAETSGQSQEQTKRVSVIYARVSSAPQRPDLERQVEDLRAAYPEYEVISEVGSGLNFHRPAFLRLLERVWKGEIKQIVVSDKDRLVRFGFELVEWITKHCNTELRIHNDQHETLKEELESDLLSIVNYFVARHNGKRSAEKRREREKRKKKEERERETKEKKQKKESRKRKRKEKETGRKGKDKRRRTDTDTTTSTEESEENEEWSSEDY